MPKFIAQDLIKKYEGLSLVPYKDVKGICTIGYGHTGVTMDSPAITQEEADKLLQSDIADTCASVLHYAYPTELNDNQYSALVSLCYNCGDAPMKGTLGDYIRKGNFANASNEFDKWCHAGKKVILGLQLRRAAEKALFLRESNPPV